MQLERDRDARVKASRAVIGVSAALATTPYLVLKGLWISGSTLGMNDPRFFDNATYRAANIASFGLDAVAAAVALALTFPWGRRLPAWLVLLPLWVGTGLLGTIVVLLPIAVPLAGGTSAAGAEPDPLKSWVYVVVYAGFTLQGLLLLTAFAFYARDRWTALLSSSCCYVNWGRTRRAAVVLRLAGGLAVGLSLLHFSWAFGLTAGLAGLSQRQTGVDLATLGVYGLFSLAAAQGVLLIDAPRRRSPGRPRLRRMRTWVPLTLLWLGTGSMFSWGAYFLAIAAANSRLSTPALTVATALKVLAALVIAVCVGRGFIGERRISLAESPRTVDSGPSLHNRRW